MGDPGKPPETLPIVALPKAEAQSTPPEIPLPSPRVPEQSPHKPDAKEIVRSLWEGFLEWQPYLKRPVAVLQREVIAMRQGWIVFLIFGIFLAWSTNWIAWRSYISVTQPVISGLQTQGRKDDEMILQLRGFIAGKKVSFSAAELMGFHDSTNVVTNVVEQFKTNEAFAIVATNFVTALPYIFDFFQMNRLKNQIETLERFHVVISYDPTDYEGFTMARQIAQIFSYVGYDTRLGSMPFVIGTNHVTGWQYGIFIAAKRVPGDPVYSALYSFFTELHEPGRWLIDTNLNDDQIHFLVCFPTNTPIPPISTFLISN